MHHRKAIVQFVGKKSDVFVNLPNLDMANPTVASKDEIHCMS